MKFKENSGRRVLMSKWNREEIEGRGERRRQWKCQPLTSCFPESYFEYPFVQRLFSKALFPLCVWTFLDPQWEITSAKKAIWEKLTFFSDFQPDFNWSTDFEDDSSYWSSVSKDKKGEDRWEGGKKWMGRKGKESRGREEIGIWLEIVEGKESQPKMTRRMDCHKNDKIQGVECCNEASSLSLSWNVLSLFLLMNSTQENFQIEIGPQHQPHRFGSDPLSARY